LGLFGSLATSSTVSHIPLCPVLPIHALAALLTPAPLALVLQIPIPDFWTMRKNKGPSHRRNPFGRPALRPAYPTSFSPPTPGPAPSPSPTPDPLPIPIAPAPQCVSSPHTHTPPQSPHPRKNRASAPAPTPYITRRLYASTKPIPDPLPIPNAAPQFLKKTRNAAFARPPPAASAPAPTPFSLPPRQPAPSCPIPDPLPIPIPARPRNSRYPPAPHLRTDAAPPLIP